VRSLADAVEAELDALVPLSPAELTDQRYRRFRALGAFEDRGE
jgi:acetyl-CoA carboxylase alpha subunit